MRKIIGHRWIFVRESVILKALLCNCLLLRRNLRYSPLPVWYVEIQHACNAQSYFQADLEMLANFKLLTSQFVAFCFCRFEVAVEAPSKDELKIFIGALVTAGTAGVTLSDTKKLTISVILTGVSVLDINAKQRYGLRRVMVNDKDVILVPMYKWAPVTDTREAEDQAMEFVSVTHPPHSWARPDHASRRVTSQQTLYTLAVGPNITASVYYVWYIEGEYVDIFK